MMLPSLDLSLFIVFFIYGLSFLVMGLVLILEASRTPGTAETRLLRPLAFFGLVHGLHEWIEAYLLQAQSFGVSLPEWVVWLRLGLLLISFSLLLFFGIRIFNNPNACSHKTKMICVAGFSIYGIAILAIALANLKLWDHIQPETIDVFSRYLLAFPGSLLTSLAFQTQAEGELGKAQGIKGRYLLAAGLGFGIYAVSQLFVQRLDFFPAGIINSDSFREMTGIPIQVIRAIMAALITWSIFKWTQQTEAERNRELALAQKNRVEALERVQKELSEKEALRRELLRHIVQAQEDERARIARELHDETAQTLAALSLDLATMQSLTPDKPECKAVSARLLKLNKELSRGLYRLVHDLRPAQLDDLGLIPALQYLVEQDFSSNGLQVQFEIKGTIRRLDGIIETVLFRVTQEALVNVSRHAGTKLAKVTLHFKNQEIVLEVQDHGKGFDPNQNFLPPHGWGLTGMKERIEAVGGSLEVDSSPGNGTLINASIPLFDLIP